MNLLSIYFPLEELALETLANLTSLRIREFFGYALLDAMTAVKNR